MILRLSLFLIFTAAAASACVCAGPGPSVKQAWERTPAVFLGTVEFAKPNEGQLIFQKQSVRIRVEEVFKGPVSAGQTIELHQANNDCAAKFRRGQRAVFYLHAGSAPGTWRVVPCSYAHGSADPLGDDLLFLRGLPDSVLGTRLSGGVDLYEESLKEGLRRVAGIPNLRLNIVGQEGIAANTITNAAGVYEVFGLPPGRYTVSFEVPDGLVLRYASVQGSPRVPGNAAAVELAANGGASVNFIMQADTQLSGRMLNAKGKPLGDVCIDLEPAESRLSEQHGRIFSCSEKGGAFSLKRMPPGDYRLVARDTVKAGRHRSESTLYYPGVRDREHAATISIAAGQHIEHVDLHLPAQEIRHKVSGRLQFADGVPVPDAKVTFTSEPRGYIESTSSGRDGSFAFSVVAGMEGVLSAQIAVLQTVVASCPDFQVDPQSWQGLFGFLTAKPLALFSESDRLGLLLQIPARSCRSYPLGRK